MESIKEIYKIGHGPSSSHTMGPRRAAEIFYKKNKNAQKFKVTLYGSLAATGKGHLTDKAILEILSTDKTMVDWQPAKFLPTHPNAVKFEAFNSNGDQIDDWTVYSIGGGRIIDDHTDMSESHFYELTKMKDILAWCEKNGKTFWQFVENYEDSGLWDYLMEVWEVMQDAVKRGIDNEGSLPGILNLARKAPSYHIKAFNFKGTLKRRSLLFAYALGVAEENAAGGLVVTAPTCGSCGVIPAILYHSKKNFKISDKKIMHALATAGLVGNLVKENGSISGAEVGCQGEIGTACSMAAAAIAQLLGGTPRQIEYAAELGLEHHLGLTCDPIGGLVQVPCIERNAIAAARALDSAIYATLSDGSHIISFDKVVKAMKLTGKDLPSLYKETSEGGLAFLYQDKISKNSKNEE